MAEKNPVRFGLVGIGGYGATYVNMIETVEREGLGTFGAAVIRTRGKYPEKEAQLAGRSVPFYATIEDMLRQGRRHFDIAAIPTGIDVHRDHLVQSVEAGFDAILEKPTTATIQDFDVMSDALKRTGKWCQIGFQSQSAPNVRRLKRTICDGRLGRIKAVVARCLWMRDNHYYERNAWAGKLTNGGRYTLDGCINNPQAHYLFNALFFASDEWGAAAMPRTVRAELYHAHEIESEDTACMEVICDNGAKVCFYGTLAASDNQPVVIEVFGEKGRATWDIFQNVTLYDGEKTVEHWDPPAIDGRVELWRNAVRVFRGEEQELYCPLEMTRSHVLAVNGAFLSARGTRQIPSSALKITEETQPKLHIRTVISGIEEIVAQASAEQKLFSDIGVPWATATRANDVSGLKEFSLPA